jgi:drug/metabolite transporter (DMT)-like permease
MMKTKTWIALLAIYIVWGSTYLGIRIAVETIPPFLMAATRFLLAGGMLFLWRRMAGDLTPTPRQWRNAAIVGAFLLLGGNGVVSWAEKNVESGITALLIGSTPMWLVLIEALRRGGSRPGPRAVIGLLIGFTGIAILLAPTRAGAFSHIFLPGALAILFAAFSWALGSIYSRNADMPSSVLMGSAAEMLAASLGLFLVSGISGEWGDFSPATVSSRSLFGLLYLVFFGSLVGFVAYAWLLRNTPVSIASTYAYVNPLVAVLLGAWIGQEGLSARVLVAAVVIVGAVALINTSPARKSAEGVPSVASD